MRPFTFLRTLFFSATTSKYYIEVLNAKFWFSFRFVLMSYLVFSLIAGTFFVFFEVPNYSKYLKTYLDEQIHAFPKDAQITWDGQKFSTNLEETYTLPFPKLPDVANTPPLLLQFSPEVESVSDIAQHSVKPSIIYIGSSDIFVSQPDGSWSVLALADVDGLAEQNFTLTAETLQENTLKMHQALQAALRFASLAFPFFFLVASLFFRLLNTFLDTLLIYVCVRLVGMPIGFKKVFQISLHVMVVAEMLSLLTLFFHTGIQMYSITFWIYIILIYLQLRNVRILPTSVLFDQGKDQS